MTLEERFVSKDIMDRTVYHITKPGHKRGRLYTQKAIMTYLNQQQASKTIDLKFDSYELEIELYQSLDRWKADRASRKERWEKILSRQTSKRAIY